MRVDDTQREIAKRVRDAIDRAGISQSELARRIGWPQPRLNRRLTPADYAAPFTAAELVDVAAALGVPVAELYPAPAPAPEAVA